MMGLSHDRPRGMVRSALTYLWCLMLLATLVSGINQARAEVVYTLTNTGIYSVDLTTGGPAVLLTSAAPFPQTLAATLATRPSDGMLFFLDGTGTNPGLWRWDPSAPATPPVFVGAVGASFTGVLRLGFDATGTLYAMNPGPGATLWALDTNSGGILTATATTVATTDVAGGGDICRQSGTGTLYMVSQGDLFTVTPAGLITFLGAVTGLPAGAANTGCAFDRIGRLLISPTGTDFIHTVNIGTLAATALATSTGLGNGNMGDLASSLGRVSDLSLTKTASNATPGTTVSFTITVTNGGPDRTTDVRVLDALPAGLTLVTATASQGVYSAIAVALPGGLGNYPAGTWRVGTLNNGANATLTISATVAAGAGSITNTAQVSYSDNADPDSTPNNSVAGEDDQASVTITRSPDLQIVKAAASTFVVNNPGGTYTLTVNNLLGSATAMAE